MLSRDQIASISNLILADALGPSGFDHVDVEVRDDADGDAAIFLTAHFHPSARVTDPKISLDARVRLLDALRERQEARFPYLRYFYPDDDRPADDRKDAAE